MDGIKQRTGNYLHAEGAKAIKSFGDRKFIVLIAGAFDAMGLVGPEHNGIAVLDENRKEVLLDRHMPIASGYFGPSRDQQAEMQRIMAMDWKAFSQFVTTNPRYRGVLPDAGMPEPDPVIPVDDREIFPESARVEGNPYSEPLHNRKEIIDFLLSHSTHSLDGPYSKSAFAWNIKVPYDFDSSGKSMGQGEPEADSRFDERWEAHVQQDDGELFNEAARQALSQYTEGLYTLYEGDRQGLYEFSQSGRQGGWLVLTKLGDLSEDRLTWSTPLEREDFLLDLTDEQLVHLYRVVNQLDQDLAKPKIRAEMAYQYAFLRQGVEEGWAQELAQAPSP